MKPLVNLIWLAGLVFVLGALITLWPDAREQRRLAVRYGDATRPRRLVSVALVLGALLAAACVVLVALPYLREPAPERDALDDLGELEQRQLELAEVRDRALGALKELEFDHRTARCRTTTIARSSARCGARRPRRSARSSRARALARVKAERPG